jgi:hypothetical protein
MIPRGECRSSLLPVSFVARGRSTEKRRDSVVADTKDRVCETRDTVEISSYARGGSGVCTGVESTATSPYSPSMLIIARA